jgi:hypothetical protein
MASQHRVTINHDVAEKILKGQIGTVVDVMEGLAAQVVAATGQPDEYDTETWIGISRARVSINTATPKARRDEATDHVLLTALGSVQSG